MEGFTKTVTSLTSSASAVTGMIGAVGAAAQAVFGLFGMKKEEVKVVYEDNPELIRRMGDLEKLLAERKISDSEAALELKALQQQLMEARAQHDANLQTWQNRTESLRAQLDEHSKWIQEHQLTTLNGLKQYDQHRFDRIVDLASTVPPIPMHSHPNIGFIGLTCSGKSSLINTLAGQPLCAVGPGETTTHPLPHRAVTRGPTCTFWDIPGRNDEFCYFTSALIALFKSMDHLGVVITSTPKEMSDLTRLLEMSQIEFYFVVNKIDMISPSELEAHQAQLRSAVHPREVFFVSATHPTELGELDALRSYLNLSE